MSSTDKQELIKNIHHSLDELRHHFKVDNGDIEIVDVTDDNIVQIKWLGNCEACSIKSMTKAVVEQTIKTAFPQIKSVEAINGVVV